jgi:hypothetical protein
MNWSYLFRTAMDAVTLSPQHTLALLLGGVVVAIFFLRRSL